MLSPAVSAAACPGPSPSPGPPRAPSSPLSPQWTRPPLDTLTFPSNSLRPPPRQSRSRVLSRGSSKPSTAPDLPSSSSSPLLPLAAVAGPDAPALRAGASHCPSLGQPWQRSLPKLNSTLSLATNPDTSATYSPAPLRAQPDSSWDSPAYPPSPALWSPSTPTCSLMPQPSTPTLAVPSSNSSTSLDDPSSTCPSTAGQAWPSPALPLSPQEATLPRSCSGLVTPDASFATAHSSGTCDHLDTSSSTDFAVTVPSSRSPIPVIKNEDNKDASCNPARTLRSTRSLFSIFSRSKLGKAKGLGSGKSLHTPTVALASTPGSTADRITGSRPRTRGYIPTHPDANIVAQTETRGEGPLPSNSSIVPTHGAGRAGVPESPLFHPNGCDPHESKTGASANAERPQPHSVQSTLPPQPPLTARIPQVSTFAAQSTGGQMLLSSHSATHQPTNQPSCPAKSPRLLASGLDTVCARRGRAQNELKTLTSRSPEVAALALPYSPAGISAGLPSTVPPTSPHPSLPPAEVPSSHWDRTRSPSGPATCPTPMSPSSAAPHPAELISASTSVQLPPLPNAPTALDSARARSALLARSIQLEADIREMSTQLWGVRLALGPGGPTGCPCCGGTLS